MTRTWLFDLPSSNDDRSVFIKCLVSSSTETTTSLTFSSWNRPLRRCSHEPLVTFGGDFFLYGVTVVGSYRFSRKTSWDSFLSKRDFRKITLSTAFIVFLLQIRHTGSEESSVFNIGKPSRSHASARTSSLFYFLSHGLNKFSVEHFEFP